LNAFPGFGLFAGATGSDPSDRFVDRMARHFVTQHVIVWQRPIGYKFTGRPLPPCAAGKIERAAQMKTFPIDFTHKFPVARGGARCQGMVRLHSIIRTAYLQAPVRCEFLLVYFCEFVLVYFWRGGLFRNDKDAHSLLELGAPFSVRCGISRR